MLTLVLVGMLAAAPPKDNVGLIIWGGGKAPADGERAKADLTATW